MRLPLLSMLIVIFMTLAIDTYILLDIRGMSGRRTRRRNGLVYLLTCLPCWALLIVAMCLPIRNTDSSILPVMWLLFVFFSIFVPKALYVICSLIGRLCNFRSRRLVNYGAMAGIPVAVVGFCLMWYGVLVTRNDIEVRNVDIVSAKVPESFEGYRILQFSDLHTGTWGNDTVFVSRLVDNINALKPDMIMFTGDVVNRQTCELNPFVKILSRLKAKDGVYSVLGNHDYGDYVNWNSDAEKKANIELMNKLQRQMGWKLLNNSSEYVKRGNDSIYVIGVENWGEPPFNQYGDLLKACGGKKNATRLRDNNFKVLMTHNPEHWKEEVVRQSNIDLSLSGHTHAMQMEMDIAGLRLSPAAMRYSYWGGLYAGKSTKGEPMSLYVNIGAGEVAVPMRIGATPELTVLTLKRK